MASAHDNVGQLQECAGRTAQGYSLDRVGQMGKAQGLVDLTRDFSGFDRDFQWFFMVLKWFLGTSKGVLLVKGDLNGVLNDCVSWIHHGI